VSVCLKRKHFSYYENDPLLLILIPGIVFMSNSFTFRGCKLRFIATCVYEINICFILFVSCLMVPKLQYSDIEEYTSALRPSPPIIMVSRRCHLG